MERVPEVTGVPLAPFPEVEAALSYLLEKSPEGWRLDEKVERAMLEAERLKWVNLPLPHVMIDFLEYWMLMKPWKDRPHSTHGWRQAWRNWCRIERERAEARKTVGVRGEGKPASPSTSRLTPHEPKAPPLMDRQEARAKIRELKERFGPGPSAHQLVRSSAPEEDGT